MTPSKEARECAIKIGIDSVTGYDSFNIFAAEDVIQSALDAAVATYKADAKRYRHLKDNHSWHYGVTHNSPMECGIACGFQPLDADRQGWSVEDFLDEEIAHAERNKDEADDADK